MRSLPVSRTVAVVLLLALTTGVVVSGTVVVTPAAAASSTVADGAVSTTDSVSSGASITQSTEAEESQPDNFTVAVETPGTIVANASQNYSVRVDGAEGNVSAAWTFEGERKTGESVRHEFSTDGNATIEVTVTDESGASVTRTLQVRVIEFGDDDDAADPLDNAATMAAVVATFIGIKAVLFLYVFPKGMLVFADAL